MGRRMLMFNQVIEQERREWMPFRRALCRRKIKRPLRLLTNEEALQVMGSVSGTHEPMVT